MDAMNLSETLTNEASEMKTLAFAYKDARASFAEAKNWLIVQMHKKGLSKSKSAFENSMVELLDLDAESEKYIKQFNNSEAEYKGIEKVLNAYQAQISGMQSVIKYNLAGERN